mgnify:CR=1 FL=1
MIVIQSWKFHCFLRVSRKLIQRTFARNCRLARLTRVEHVSLCVGRSETVDYARDEFRIKAFETAIAAAAAPSMGKVEAAVRGLQGGKEDMVASWRGELFPCRKINL